MKKLLFVFCIISVPFLASAQSGTSEDFERMREQMMENMEEMMKMFEGSFDFSEGPAIKIDTFFFKNFGGTDGFEGMAPGQDMQSFFEDFENMLKQHFGDFESMPFDSSPAIPGPEDLEENHGEGDSKESAPIKKKKKRKRYDL